MKFQFPHFPLGKPARFVSSLEMFLLWTLLIGIVTINLISVRGERPAYWNKLMMLFETPFSVNRHMDLASLLWKQGNKTEAKQLIASAETGSVLGTMTDPKSVLALWEKEADERNKQYAFWKSVATAEPDYRDAYIALTVLSLELDRTEEARAWLAKAQTIDPNSLTVQKLREYLQ